ncbi:hypothetical protein ACFOET_06700, partial [Parapedobacter deserti]
MNTKTHNAVSVCLTLMMAFLFMTGDATGQLVLNKAGATGEHTAPTGITLGPGFQSTGDFRAYISPAAAVLG